MPDLPVKRPELLAPAGGMESLRAALAAGADAVYLGLDELNARRGAENFSRENLTGACNLAHMRGRKVYLTANVVILPDELSTALGMIDFAWAAGVDAVIIQDLGLIRAVRASLPHVRVHVSTQVNAHSSDTLRALQSLGVARVTLARETSIEEISSLSRLGAELGVEVESFVHGAICICYSGQCLFSSMVGGRSANRGLCAQPCRLPYELVDEAGGVLGDVGAHLLSPKDLAGISVLPRYVHAGVDSLKIEGRMKSAEYVALVTGVYRAALDRAASVPDDFGVRAGELSVLSEAFSRGFTEAYLVGETGNEMMSYRRPNNRGVPVGRVAESRGGRTTLVTDVALDSDDTIEFWTSQGRFAQRVGPLEYSSAVHASAPAGERVTLSTEESTNGGDRVFRVRNAALTAAAERLYSDTSGSRIDLGFAVRVVLGAPLAVTVTDAEGRMGSASGAVVEAARTKAVSAQEIQEHVGRLGGTPYTAASWDIELSPQAGVGFSAIHAVRRAALDDYESAVLSPWTSRTTCGAAVPSLGRPARPPQRPRLVTVAGSPEAARACLEAGADEAHVSANELVGEDVAANVAPLVPRVCHDAECAPLLDTVRSAGRGVAGTLGALWRLAQDGREVQAHWSLNALNEQSVAQLAELGASLVWLSPELTLAQVRAITRGAIVPVGVAVGGRQELMVTEHCVLTSEGPCAQKCESCPRRGETRFLRDRKGYRFPVTTDSQGRTHLYNSVPLDATGALPELIEAGVAALRLDLETETAESAARETARLRSALDRIAAGVSVKKPEGVSTSGHFFRGVR
ncbi:MAG TPA: DUF3656 domain-containing protein [Coriobacteriia bacterium]|nr:DUF3656 domain-containing protein [Coriobacteriia bacterium]